MKKVTDQRLRHCQGFKEVVRVGVTAYLLQGRPITENKPQRIERIERMEGQRHQKNISGCVRLRALSVPKCSST